MAVAVRPEKLRAALGAKLLSAVQALNDLREADKPEINRICEPHRQAAEFLHAARGVYPTIKTFGDENLQPAGFKKWVEEWENSRLSDSERKMWQMMRTARIAQEHGDGALIPHQIEVTRGDQIQVWGNAALLGIPPEQIDKRSFKSGVRLAAYPDRPASEVCAEYFELCQRFAEDFQRDHAYLIPSEQATGQTDLPAPR
jgi:hypothetical protein